MAFSRQFVAPREERLKIIGGGVGQSLQQILNVLKGPQTVLLGCLNNGIDDGTGTCTVFGGGEQPIFASDDKGFDRAFRPIV